MTAPLVRLHSAARPLFTIANSEMASGDGFTTTLSGPSAALSVPSRYQAFAPPWLPLTLMPEPTMCVGSGNPPNWLSNPNTEPDGPVDWVTPGSNCASVWISRPTIGT